AALLLVAVGGLSVAAERFHRRIEAGAVDWRTIPHHASRASVLAMQGAARATDSSVDTFVFVGASTMRSWLPTDEEADAVGSAAAGRPVRLLAMCGDLQTYATSAALIDRFGADFPGWFVISVSRQLIDGRRGRAAGMRRRRASQELGFHSEVQRRVSTLLGHPQESASGWEVWDRRRFYYRALVKPALGLPWTMPWERNEKSPPTAGRGAPAVGSVGVRASPPDPELLDRHLDVLREVATSLRGRGGARLALVETPWENDLVPGLRSPEQATHEDVYRRRLQAWAEDNDIPWITTPTTFAATSADFDDARHVGSPALRRRFVEVVVRELSAH
ncbi:MAG: hypothetical protein ACKOHK_03210, partial [Planctomycetia bacterium]